MDYTVHGILQAGILEWVAFPFYRGSFQPRDQTQVFCIAGRIFTSWATREAQKVLVATGRNIFSCGRVWKDLENFIQLRLVDVLHVKLDVTVIKNDD